MLAMATGALFNGNRPIRICRDTSRLRGRVPQWDKFVLAAHAQISKALGVVGHVETFLRSWAFCRVRSKHSSLALVLKEEVPTTTSSIVDTANRRVNRSGVSVKPNPRAPGKTACRLGLTYSLIHNSQLVG